MRELVFITGRDPSQGKGGGSSYVRAHAHAARRAGFTPHIFCADERAGVSEGDYGFVHRVRSPLLPRWASSSGLDEHSERFSSQWLLAFSANPYTVPLHSPWLVKAVAAFLARSPGPHLIHAFYTWGAVGLRVQERLRRKGIEVAVVSSVYTTAESEAHARAQSLSASARSSQRVVFEAERLWIETVVKRYERRAYASSRLVLLNYDSVRRLFLAAHGEGAETRRLPYCSEAAFLHEGRAQRIAPPALLTTRKERTAPLIVSVSRHDPRKGLDILIRALAELRARGVRFRACLVSGGPLLGTHRRMVKALGLADVTTLTGWVADSYPYLLSADVFVLPSLQEGSGSVSLLEALQAGAAVVASNVDGIPEDVVDGDSGLLVDPGNVDALASALAVVVSDDALRARLRRRARETFVERFSADALVEALGDLYAELGFAEPRQCEAVEAANSRYARPAAVRSYSLSRRPLS